MKLFLNLFLLIFVATGCSSTKLSLNDEEYFVIRAFEIVYNDKYCEACIDSDSEKHVFLLSEKTDYFQSIYNTYNGTTRQLEVTNGIINLTEDRASASSFNSVSVEKISDDFIAVKINIRNRNKEEIIKVNFVKIDEEWLSYSFDCQTVQPFISNSDAITDLDIVKLAFDYFYRDIFCRSCYSSEGSSAKFFIHTESSYSKEIYSTYEATNLSISWMSNIDNLPKLHNAFFINDIVLVKSSEEEYIVEIFTEYLDTFKVKIIKKEGHYFPVKISGIMR